MEDESHKYPIRVYLGGRPFPQDGWYVGNGDVVAGKQILVPPMSTA